MNNINTNDVSNTNTKFCKFCGEKIAMDAIICPKCGRQVEPFPTQVQPAQPIVINNSSSAAAGAANVAPQRRKKHYSVLLDIFLIFLTGGLWIIWMLARPKYE